MSDMPEHDDTERDPSERDPSEQSGRDTRTGRAAAAARIAQQATWVDLQISRAVERGDFDDLPGAGKPLELGQEHDPDWWLKKLVERERVALLPASLQLRKDDAELDDRIDELATEDAVRREVEEFNQRVRRARYQPPQGPPLITQLRDVEDTVAAWRTRRTARREAARRVAAPPQQVRRSWWSRLRDHRDP